MEKNFIKMELLKMIQFLTQKYNNNKAQKIK